MITKREFYIDGKWVSPLVARDCPVIDPSTVEIKVPELVPMAPGGGLPGLPGAPTLGAPNLGGTGTAPAPGGLPTLPGAPQLGAPQLGAPVVNP